MHHIYHTKGIILGGKNTGESSRLLYILTKDFGLVFAVAQGVRELKSKLRYSLQDFNVSAVSLVRGKDIWRVTSAENQKSFRESLQTPEKVALVARIFSLLRRLLAGEEKNEALFIIAGSLLDLLERNEFSREEMWRLEIIVNLQIFSVLGYESPKPTLKPLMHALLSRELLGQMEGKEKTAVREINRALEESQL